MKTIKTEKIWYYQLAHDNHYIIRVVFYYTKDDTSLLHYKLKAGINYHTISVIKYLPYRQL